LDGIAYEQMNYWVKEAEINEDRYGITLNSMYYDGITNLDVAEAIKFFSLWYEQGNFYDYTQQPRDQDAGKFIAHHVIFIMLLEILVN